MLFRSGAEGLAEDRWLDVKYVQSKEGMERFSAVWEPFCLEHTKEELVADGRKWRVPLSAVSTPKDVLASRQLDYRKFFVETWNAAAGRPIKMPGAPYKLLGTPWRQQRPAPSLGQHTAEVLGEIGVTQAELDALFASKVI